MQGNFRANVEKLSPGRETFGGNGETVDSEREVLRNVTAVGGDLKRAMELIGFAQEIG